MFYIENFKVQKIGNIVGRGCHVETEKDGIYINRIKEGKEILLETLPIDTIDKYENYKWGFIKDYWANNYKNFIVE